MRIIIAGSRTATEEQVRDAIEYCDWVGFVSCVVSGGAKGADQVGEKWAKEKGLEISLFPADWEKYGKRAGPMRNKLMAENADGLIAVWDGKSRGTASMIELARGVGLRVFIFRTDINGIKEHAPSGKSGGLWEAAEERAAMIEFSGGLSRSIAEREAGRLVIANRESFPSSNP